MRDVAGFRPRGVVFDLDGTLVDNIGLHIEAFVWFARRHGLEVPPPERRVELDGRRNSEVFPVLVGRPLEPAELEAFETEKENYYRQLSAGKLAPLSGLRRLLACLAARGIPVAVATSAPAENVRHTLDELGLRDQLTEVVRGDQVARGKPWPDVFVAAAARLGVPPSECLAFEDTPSGIAAARAAGMTCVAVTTGFPGDALAGHDPAPDAIVCDYDAFLDGPGAWLCDPTASSETGPT